MKVRPRVLLPLFLIVLLAAWFTSGLRHELSWQALAAHQATLQGWATQAPVRAGLAYVLAYAALVSLSLPLGGVLTVTGGWLFGAAAGAALAVLAATLGAVTLFLLARGALAPLVARRAGPLLQSVRHGLQTDGFSYLLAMRLIPVVPFWIGNLAPALAGMRLAPFAAATLIGIAPTTVVLAGVGAGLGSVLAAGGQPDLLVLRTPAVLMPLLGLAAVSLLPVAWRRWRRLRP